VYAADHQPVRGDKLVGGARLGTMMIGPNELEYSPMVGFQNPDCVKEITITQVSIIKTDWELGPTVIYEGPYIYVDEDGNREIVTRPMKPHEQWTIVLCHYMYDGVGDPEDSSSWLSAPAALQQESAAYSVEIAWEAARRACPLIGGTSTTVEKTNIISGETYNMMSRTQLVQLNQRAK
jgi:hypothetical protein